MELYLAVDGCATLEQVQNALMQGIDNAIIGTSIEGVVTELQASFDADCCCRCTEYSNAISTNKVAIFKIDLDSIVEFSFRIFSETKISKI